MEEIESRAFLYPVEDIGDRRKSRGLAGLVRSANYRDARFGIERQYAIRETPIALEAEGKQPHEAASGPESFSAAEIVSTA